ncbi:MAG: helix-turn-helix transcriptional regulator [Pseudomonadales bacterium]|nr:helix-turn-helix transcriptional regulator [Pseudomonadales bacterium]
MHNKKTESELNVDSSNSVPILTHGIGTRINAITSQINGGKRQLAKQIGLSEAQLHRIIAGQSQTRIETIVSIAKVAGVSIEWLATGEGPMRPQPADVAAGGQPSGGTAAEVFDRIEALLEAVDEVPVSHDALSKSPELQGAHRDLQRLAADQSLQANQRARADMMLRVAFGDSQADARYEARVHDTFSKLRQADDTVKRTCSLVDYTPSPMLRSTIVALVAEGMTDTQLYQLLATLKADRGGL